MMREAWAGEQDGKRCYRMRYEGFEGELLGERNVASPTWRGAPKFLEGLVEGKYRSFHLHRVLRESEDPLHLDTWVFRESTPLTCR